MRLIVILKILLAIGCIYLSFRLFFINYSIDNSIHEQVTALVKLKNDPALDSAENRKRYTQRNADINKKIYSLYKKRYSKWYEVIGLILAFISSGLLKNITTILFKKRTKIVQEFIT